MGSKVIVKKPIFIVGCGRSGTTLLFDWLSQHPCLNRTTGYPDGEDHEGWIRHGHCMIAGIGNPNSDRFGIGINGYNSCLHMTAADVTPEVRQAMHNYYATEILGLDFDKRVINKCPHNSNKIGYLLGLFPDAKIIHIIRDCTPVVASWIAIMKAVPTVVAYWPDEEFPCLWLMQRPESEVERSLLDRHKRFYPGGGAALWVDYWCKTNMGIETQMRGHLNQLLTVRYEDLVAAPQLVLGRITSFCEMPAHRYSTGNVDSNTALRHCDLLTEEVVAAIKKKAEEVRRYFGYSDSSSLVNPGPLPSRLYIPTKAEFLNAKSIQEERVPSETGAFEENEYLIDLDESQIAPHEEIILSDAADAYRRRFISRELNLDECLVFYGMVVKQNGSFPLDWEYYVLQLGLKKYPNRPDLLERVKVVSCQLQDLPKSTG